MQAPKITVFSTALISTWVFDETHRILFDAGDGVTALLPAYAGRAGDPRTPQNLVPVAGLEAWLRHRIGDRGIIRRSLLAWLATREG